MPALDSPVTWWTEGDNAECIVVGTGDRKMQEAGSVEEAELAADMLNLFWQILCYGCSDPELHSRVKDAGTLDAIGVEDVMMFGDMYRDAGIFRNYRPDLLTVH